MSHVPPLVLCHTDMVRVRGNGWGEQVHVFVQRRLGLWIWCGKQRNVVPPLPAQRRAPVLLTISQCLWQGLPFALWEQQNGQNSQQGKRRVDYMVQEVAVVVAQVHQRRAKPTHAAKSQDSTHPTSPGKTKENVHDLMFGISAAVKLMCPSSILDFRIAFEVLLFNQYCSSYFQYN